MTTPTGNSNNWLDDRISPPDPKALLKTYLEARRERVEKGRNDFNLLIKYLVDVFQQRVIKEPMTYEDYRTKTRTVVFKGEAMVYRLAVEIAKSWGPTSEWRLNIVRVLRRLGYTALAEYDSSMYIKVTMTIPWPVDECSDAEIILLTGL